MNITTQEHNGIIYNHIILQDKHGLPKEYEGVLCFGKKDRFTLNGIFDIILVKNIKNVGREWNKQNLMSDKQIQLRIRAPTNDCAVSHDTRNNSKWDSHDICIPIEDLPQVIQALQCLLELSKRRL